MTARRDLPQLPGTGDLLAGRYRIEHPLGSGGFATVFGATDLNTDRSVAVKVLRPHEREGYSAYRIARFEREIAATRRLRSPHTVTLLDAGTSDGGALFMVFELVAGRDLSELISTQGRLPAPDVRHILLQLLESLEEAHQAGLLHRDIKPANIRVFTAGDDPYRVKLLDFGIAKPTSEDAPTLTATGQVLGTLKYCAPEQAFGGVLTAASDLYALALVAYELLTGEACDHLARIARDEPVALAPDQCDDEELRKTLNRLLALKVEQRIQTAAEVRRILLGKAQPPARQRTAHPAPEPTPARRLPMTAVIPIATVVALVGFAAVVATLRPEAPPPTAAAGSRLVPSLVRSEPAPEPFQGVQDAGPSDVGSGKVDSPCGAEPPFRGRGRLTSFADLREFSWFTYIPSTYANQSPSRLVILLHEAGESPEGFFDDTKIQQLAEREQVIVVAPQGAFVETWMDSLEPAVVALRGTTEQLCVDLARVYAIGHGFGGTGAEELPCAFPVAAVATTSNRNFGPRSCGRAEAARIHFAGLHDGYNPVKGGPSCSGVQKIALAEMEEHWRTVQGCRPPREKYLEHGESVCHTWSCEKPFVSCRLDGGRNWPGVHNRVWDLRNCDHEPADFPLLDVIWTFFEAQQRAP